MDQKTVFISYRRSLSKHLARSIYMDLRHHGWDVFLDVNTIDSGDFDRIILNQIGARTHFLLLISPGSLERCENSDDWVLREIQEAVSLGRNIVPVIEEGADFTREVGYLPPNLRDVVSKKNALPLPHFFFDAAVEMLRNRFLKVSDTIPINPAPVSETAEIQRMLAEIDKVTESISWVNIPDKSYSIARYPVTNLQYRQFVEAGGYKQTQFWTKAGWIQREKNNWQEPLYWNDKDWNSAEKPVVGVSWHEAVAFCLWLSSVTDEKITLPTEEQWQYAAQGDDERVYPWGSNWECDYCNNSVKPCKSNTTTPVMQYEGRGNSPFGVIDMAGNVWEWCLTDYMDKVNDINSNAALYVVKGGSWSNQMSKSFRCDCRDGYGPNLRYTSGGFRILHL